MRYFPPGATLALLLSLSLSYGGSFESSLPDNIERIWIGQQYWSNPLQDWKLNDGRMECISSGGERNVFVLTTELDSIPADFHVNVNLGQLSPFPEKLEKDDWAGIRVGILGEFNDYRDSAVRGRGISMGVRGDGSLFIGDSDNRSSAKLSYPFKNLNLELDAKYVNGSYTLSLTASDKSSSARVSLGGVNPEWVHGGVALFSSSSKPDTWDWDKPRPDYHTDPNTTPRNQGEGGEVKFWFKNLEIKGDKVTVKENHAWGPILFTLHTLNEGVLKMTAQFAPLESANRTAYLQIKEKNSEDWKTIDEAYIDPLSFTAAFKKSGWNDSEDTAYRISCLYATGKGSDFGFYEGLIPRNPSNKQVIVVAGFTGNNDYGFPHNDVVEHVKSHKPDILVYTGDQIYERVGDFGVQRQVVDVKRASLDYLRKWYIFGWEYQELLRRLPSLCLPDDHDVFQGNIWGAGGRRSLPDPDWGTAQTNGGYIMPATWVNMSQRTQTSHHPDPYDPTPVDQGISVYYCSLNLGGLDLAVVEDRKWKSSPTEMLAMAGIDNGWAQNPDFNAKTDADVKGAVLLGKRQLDFLGNWVADWSDGVWMKAVVSQTLFSDLATRPDRKKDNTPYPRMLVLPPGEYPPDDNPVVDLDSDGWPQSGRNAAINVMRKGFALHICGDSHLGNTIQYGIKDWGDAGYAHCVPAVANLFPRRWFPSIPGANREPDAPKYTGDFEDGFGNKMTVLAVSNPHAYGVEPAWINNRAPGYGIIKFNKANRNISMANWPRWVDPAAKGAHPYPGWPITINQTDNYGRKAVAWLPMVELHQSVAPSPVVKVYDSSTHELIYALRIQGTFFRPPVFDKGRYDVIVTESGTGRTKEFKFIDPGLLSDRRRLIVSF